MSTMYLGIDIAKKKFDVALIIGEKYKHKVFPNNEQGFQALIAWLALHGATSLHICMEATNQYYLLLANFLFQQGFAVSVVNPAKIKSFAQSELSRAKTDKADAKLIARFCQCMKPSLWQPAPQHIVKLQELVHRLDSLINMQQQEKNRLETAMTPLVTASLQTMIETLQQEIEKVKKQINDHIGQFPDLKHQSDLLDSIPGVGAATIAKILAFVGNVQRFRNARQLVAYAGLNPNICFSGSSVRGKSRLSKTGNALLRKALYMPALVAKRFNPCIKAFCQRLKTAGKNNMLILGAAMRKLLHLIYGVLKSGKPFDPLLSSQIT